MSIQTTSDTNPQVVATTENPISSPTGTPMSSATADPSASPDYPDMTGPATGETSGESQITSNPFAYLDDLQLEPAAQSLPDPKDTKRARTAPFFTGARDQHRVPPVNLIAMTALKSVLPSTARTALRDRRSVVLVLLVPSTAWIGPVEQACETLAKGRVEVFQGATRRSSSSDTRETEAVRALALGRPVIGIAPSLDRLPQVLVAAADHTVTIPPPDATLMGLVIARWCGTRKPVRVCSNDLAGLDLRDLAAALRRSTSVRASLVRLRRASRQRLGEAETDKAPALDDLSGYGEAKDWAQLMVADIARVREGTLATSELESAIFFGSPGTGKTLLARALAAAAKVPCRTTSIAQWFGGTSGYLNDIISQIDIFCDNLLQAAQSAGTAIGFIDELDALPSRTKMSSRAADFWTPAITHCLVRFEALRRKGVVLIGATNHVGNIDGALLRPGRFDRQFEISPPDEPGRLGILRVHLGADLAGEDLTLAARLAHGATGAVLAGHVKAARRRARAHGRTMILADLMTEIAPPDPRSPAEIRAVALHEAGHAVIACCLDLAVVQVTIMADGNAAGATRLRLSGRFPDRTQLERRALALMAGRACDRLLGHGANAGAVHDLLEVTRLVTSLHASLGLGDRLAYQADPAEAETLLRWNPSLADQVERDLQHLMRQAEALVLTFRDAIRATAEGLIRHRTLTGDEVASLVAAHPPRIRVKAGRATRPSPEAVTATEGLPLL